MTSIYGHRSKESYKIQIFKQIGFSISLIFLFATLLAYLIVDELRKVRSKDKKFEFLSYFWIIRSYLSGQNYILYPRSCNLKWSLNVAPSRKKVNDKNDNWITLINLYFRSLVVKWFYVWPFQWLVFTHVF